MFNFMIRIVVAILLSLVMYLPSYAMVDENDPSSNSSVEWSLDVYSTDTMIYVGEAVNVRHIPEGWYIDYYPVNSNLLVTREFGPYEIILVGPEGRVSHDTFLQYPHGHSYAVADN